jgi:prefoldin subunit 5
MGKFTVTDPNGVELKVTLLHVLESDHHGPTLCRVRYDDESIQLADQPEANQFLLVWAAPKSMLTADAIMKDIFEVKERLVEIEEARKQVATHAQLVVAEATRLDAELQEKTAALRDLQRERDPARIEALVAQRVLERTQALEQSVATLKADAEAQRREIGDLRASKKKLREALERLKAPK